MTAFRTASICLGILPALLAFATPVSAHVQLDAPNGGESLEVGSTFTITWHILIQHDLQNWDLWYSTTGPAGPWIEIAADLPPGDPTAGSVHTYDWTIPPEAVSTQVRVRVRQDNSATDYEDVSDGDLTVFQAGTNFQRGDCNSDGGIDIADALAYLSFAFSGGAEPTCLDACDANGDDDLNLADAVYLLSYLFLPGSPPPTAPFPDCGVDAAAGGPGCMAASAACP